MSTSINSAIPSTTIEAIARSLFKETRRYGFKQVDYLRFVNVLLDMSMKNDQSMERKNTADSAIVYDPSQKAILPLSGERVKVREFGEREDRNLFEKWITDKDGRHFLLSRITAEISDLNQLIEGDRDLFGVITLKPEEIPIGMMAFFDYDRVQRKAELRKLIGEPEFRGHGLAKEATQLWMQFGISTLELKKIYLNTLNTNIRNIKLNEELGFKVEGILRKECFFDGEYHDVLKMSYLID